MKGRKAQFGRRGRSGGAGAGHRRDKTHERKSSSSSPARSRAASAAGSSRSTHAGSSLRPGATVEGTVSANRAGYGFLRVEGLSESVFLPPPEMRGVMHGDRLRVKVTRDASARWSGTVEQVLSRGVNAFLGTVEVQGRSAWVNAADRRLQLRCAIAPSDLHGAHAGDWVIARITRHAGSASSAQGRIEKVLDPDRPVELATESAIARFDLPYEFPATVLREAQAFGDRVDPAEAVARVDLRELPLVTIDGDDARDFDDAVYAEPHPGGFRLIVAIADVSHYVRPGSALDAEAQNRGT
ncbi:MAG: RNB domain-containing ribonuclease, partial [Gammaproteobacteria bacterium]|nr:RNB domain-containing ribonuclease [Gammaproteobacteria bacterium]